MPSRSRVMTLCPLVGEVLAERLVHPAAEEQARQQHEVAAALTVDLVRKSLPGVGEGRHGG